jgi:methionyl-tRNA synthetase
MAPSSPSTRRLLVTSALPYANGPIHLGHLVEYLQTDIWVRFQKARGQKAIYICADDTHGTAIMMRAKREGKSEVDLIRAMREEHLADFEAMGIGFDHYGSTNSDANRELCAIFWQRLEAAGLIAVRDVAQLFDPQAGVFLADRFVKGKCPRCGTPDQYGDNCEHCGAAYAATDLIEPRSVHSGATPELRASSQHFVQIEQLHGFLESYTQGGLRRPGPLQPEIANYLKGHFLAEPLRDWDVSRPAPYFGFEIPGAPGNYWYVWFDAPIGYIAATHEWCQQHGEELADWWQEDKAEIHHFIGKDITYFHALFWPAMLKTAGYNLPTRIMVHGFLTVNGEKMSKSRGTFVKARTYLDHLDPAYLRYYYASKLSGSVDDLDLNLDEFQAKVNADLVGKVVNLASRTARFVSTLSGVYPDDGGLFERGSAAGQEIALAYEACDLARAMRLVMALADRANEYLDRAEPWKVKKDPSRSQELSDICTIALNLYRQIVVYLGPVLPSLASKSEALLGGAVSAWTDAQEPLLATTLGTFEHLMQRVDPNQVSKMIEDSKEPEALPIADPANPATPEDDGAALAAEPLSAVCSIDDFGKIDLRVARVVSAEHVPEAKKLLRLTVSLGGDDRRTIFAGIKAAYEPESLVGKLVVIVANLAPRQMKFGLSEGMVLCAGEGGEDLYVLPPDARAGRVGAKPGQRVR